MEIIDFLLQRKLSETEKAAFEVTLKLQEKGFEAYLAGGAVRDLLLKKEAHDIDIATSAKPEEIKQIFPKCYDRGKAFGVVAVKAEKLPEKQKEDFEVATFRSDIGILDHRRPKKIAFTTAEKDAKRRDFTINALFYDPKKSKIIDFTGGLNDLKNKIVRFVGNPDERIEEDYLRMLRAVRFTHRLGFCLDKEASRAIKKNALKIKDISAERLREELTAMLVYSNRQAALINLDELGLLAILLPEIIAMKGVPQPPEFHTEGDVWAHTLLAMENLSEPSNNQTETEPQAELIWTVLLHDVGKPPTLGRRDVPGKTKITFFEHEGKSAEMAKKILKRFRFSNQFIDQVTWAISQHMRLINAFRGMSERKQKKLFTHPAIDLLLALTRADLIASWRPEGKGDISMYQEALGKKEKFEKEAADEEKQQVEKFTLVTGFDIMKVLKIPSGPKVGEIKRKIEEAYLEGKISTREEALELIMIS